MQIQVLQTSRKRYFDLIDEIAKANAIKVSAGYSITEDILKQIRSIYLGAKAEYLLTAEEPDFEVAYHTTHTV